MNKESTIIKLSGALVLFSAILIGFSSLNLTSVNNSNTNQTNTSVQSKNNVLGLSSAAVDNTATESTSTSTNQPVTTPSKNSSTTTVASTTSYVNATSTPLESVKPKVFYFTSQTSDLLNFSFKVAYLDGTTSVVTPIETFDGFKGDSNISIAKTSKIYKFDKPFTDVVIDNKPSDIEVIFTEDPNNVVVASAFDVPYTYEKEYKKALFSALGFNLITREEWGAPSYSEWTPEFSKINRIVVHHTATSVDSTNPGNTVKAIYNDHYYRCSDNSGYAPYNCPYGYTWSDIGYNYLIDPYGNLYEGRTGGNGVIGAHAIPNSGSIGISLLGDYSTTAPSTAMLNTLTKLISTLSVLNDFSVVWQKSLYGHRDYLNTECPGTQVYNRLPQIAVNAEAQKPSIRNLIASLSFGQAFIQKNDVTDINGDSHILLILDNVSSSMKQKIQGIPTWSGTYNSYAYGNNQVVDIPSNLAGTFIGEVQLAIPQVQFSVVPPVP